MVEDVIVRIVMVVMRSLMVVMPDDRWEGTVLHGNSSRNEAHQAEPSGRAPKQAILLLMGSAASSPPRYFSIWGRALKAA